MADNNKLREKDTEISLEVAQKWVKKWKDLKDEEVSKKKVDSFLIPKYNLEQVLLKGIDAARAYIGINEAGEQTLMIVGTRYDEKTGIYKDVLPGYGLEDNNGSGIYDFTDPCPPGTADPDSPMNQ